MPATILLIDDNAVQAAVRQTILRAMNGLPNEHAPLNAKVTGTPAGDLFGVPHTGKSFRMMAIDIQTVKEGKIVKTYHMENWLSALGHLRAK